MPNLDGKTTSRLEPQGHVKIVTRTAPAELDAVDEEAQVDGASMCTRVCATNWAVRGTMLVATCTGVVALGWYFFRG